MKAKLIVEGKEFEVDINHPELEKLIKPEKKTGYERVKFKERYYSICIDGVVGDTNEGNYPLDNNLYYIANYYSDKTIAENNARADRLMRQLRRFAVEHRKEEINWNDCSKKKYSICFNYLDEDFFINSCFYMENFFGFYFDSEEAANLALKTFHDELIWYFTEYKDSL